MKGYASVTLAAALLAFLAAVILSGTIVAIVGLLVVIAGVLALLQREPSGYAVGPLLIVLGLISMLAAVGGISGEKGGIGNFGPEAGHAFAVTAGAMALLGYALVRWPEADPFWQPFPIVGATVLASVFAFLISAELGNPVAGVVWLPGMMLLVGGACTVWMMLTEPMK